MPEPSCSHKHFTPSCPECVAYRENRAEDIEAKVIAAYEEGGFRGITRYVMEITKTGER